MKTQSYSGATLWLLMAALLAFGIYLAVGTFLFSGNLQIIRSLIVLSCTLGFLGFWAVLLRFRKRRMAGATPPPRSNFPPPAA